VLYEDGESVVIKGVGSDRPSYNDLVLMFWQNKKRSFSTFSVERKSGILRHSMIEKLVDPTGYDKRIFIDNCHDTVPCHLKVHTYSEGTSWTKTSR
jgi:hypothetical protein